MAGVRNLLLVEEMEQNYTTLKVHASFLHHLVTGGFYEGATNVPLFEWLGYPNLDSTNCDGILSGSLI